MSVFAVYVQGKGEIVPFHASSRSDQNIQLFIKY